MNMHSKLAGLRAVAAAAWLSVGVLSAASASVVTVQTRQSAAPAAPAGPLADIGAYYRSTIDPLVAAAPTPGYCDAAPDSYAGLNNRNLCVGTTKRNIAFKFTVDFGLSDPQAGAMSLRVGPDFGRGGAVFFDGALLTAARDDLWWDRRFANTAELLSAIDVSVGRGNHRLEIYGLEGCCDGAQTAQFRLGTGAWTTFSSADGLALQPVPEPASLGLVLAGLAGVGVAARRRRRG